MLRVLMSLFAGGGLVLPAAAGPSPSVDPVVPDEEAPDEDGPRSYLAHPLYLDPEPPPVRACRLILLNFEGAANASAVVSRTREEALELGHRIVEKVRSGDDFAEWARRASSSRTAWSGGVFGTFAPGVLGPPLDEFLFSAELGDVSEPVVLATGVHILQRIEHEAASRQIMLAKDEPGAREMLEELRAAIEAGADFAELAQEHSIDELSRARGGVIGLVQRTREDRLLRRATFELAVWDMRIVDTPLGVHLVQRIPLDLVPPEAVETRFIRASAILTRFEGAVPFDLADVRSPNQAETLAREAYERALAGESFAELALEYTEDLGGRERAGDLGWLHRHSISIPPFLEPVFQLEPGELLEPIHTTAGWLVVRRDR